MLVFFDSFIFVGKGVKSEGCTQTTFSLRATKNEHQMLKFGCTEASVQPHTVKMLRIIQ